jgi:uncharacterized membrane protein YhaH (DUF805 family)
LRLLSPEIFFSFRGHLDRASWAVSILIVLAMGVFGATFLNGDDYDESVNALQDAPTMAAFLWTLACVFSATALMVKRFSDSQWPKWLGYTIGIIAAFIATGWGLGFFTDPLHPPMTESLIFWSAALVVFVALIVCTVSPSAPQ